MISESRFWVGLGVILLLLTGGPGLVLAQDMPAMAMPAVGPPEPKGDSEPEEDPEGVGSVDRLAAPPTVVSPNQADEGAQLYWLWCQPCHGDQGQGLTEEWRMEYPKDHRYCWGRGCHGEVPNPEGFSIPKHVPAIVGGRSLARFQMLEEIYEYTAVKMPFEHPGALHEDEALAVTAYLARAHGKWDGTPLTLENIGQIRWQPLPASKPSSAILGKVQTLVQGGQDTEDFSPLWGAVSAGGLLIGLALIGGVVLWQRRH